jgi:hypothetical protein
MGFVVPVRRFGENENCNVLWGMGFVVLVERWGENENFNVVKGNVICGACEMVCRISKM